MNKPIPLTIKPDDPDSPKGALPVDIHGIEGGGGTDIDWADVEAQYVNLIGHNGVGLFSNIIELATSPEYNLLRLDETGIRLSSGASDVIIDVGSPNSDLRFRFVDEDYEQYSITLREILGKIDELEQRLEALEP